MSEFSDLQCRIARDPIFNGVSMVFYTKRSDGSLWVVKPMQLELVPHDENTQLEPSIRLPGSSAESFLKSLADALDKQGIKTASDDHIAGELGATKYHLEDMRGLLAWFTQPQHDGGQQ